MVFFQGSLSHCDVILIVITGSFQLGGVKVLNRKWVGLKSKDVQFAIVYHVEGNGCGNHLGAVLIDCQDPESVIIENSIWDCYRNF